MGEVFCLFLISQSFCEGIHGGPCISWSKKAPQGISNSLEWLQRQSFCLNLFALGKAFAWIYFALVVFLGKYSSIFQFSMTISVLYGARFFRKDEVIFGECSLLKILTDKVFFFVYLLLHASMGRTVTSWSINSQIVLGLFFSALSRILFLILL